MKTNGVGRKYGYLWATLVLFVISLVGHWTTAWWTYIEEQNEQDQPVEVESYIIKTTRDTLENWQSEFLQLMWQVGGLAVLWYVGSPQSKEGDDRKEEKLNEILKLLDGKKGQRLIASLDRKYPKD